MRTLFTKLGFIVFCFWITPHYGQINPNVNTGNTCDKNLKEITTAVPIKKIKKSQLYSADEIFLCGTAAEITPIIKIDRKKVANGKVGKITKEVMDLYMEIVMNKNKKYSRWLTEVY